MRGGDFSVMAVDERGEYTAQSTHKHNFSPIDICCAAFSHRVRAIFAIVLGN